MKDSLEKIRKYLNDEGIDCTYNNYNLIFPVLQNSETKKAIVESITETHDVIRLSVSITFDFEITPKNKNRLAEYLHRANFNMIRGNFEYNLDTNQIRFIHYFEKDIISKKDYTIYNILISARMFRLYFDGLLDVLTTNKNPKKIINEIEKDMN